MRIGVMIIIAVVMIYVAMWLYAPKTAFDTNPQPVITEDTRIRVAPW